MVYLQLQKSTKMRHNHLVSEFTDLTRLFYILGGCEKHSHSDFFVVFWVFCFVVWEYGALDGLLQTAGAFGRFIFRRDTQHATRAM